MILATGRQVKCIGTRCLCPIPVLESGAARAILAAMKPDIREMTLPELQDALEALGARPFAAAQVFGWLHKRCVHDFSRMTTLPAGLRERLSRECNIGRVETVRSVRSQDGTFKLLLALGDGLQVETVFLTDQRRKTQCVSVQVGCPLGCIFCATAQLGFRRSLTAGEIIAQVEDSQKQVGRAGNLVFMGMGEPFLNYENLVRAIRILNDAKGAGIGARRMTVSTAGIPEGIRRFARENLQVRLALSLNATTDEQRSRLMPVNRKYPLTEVLDALKYYTRESGRRATIEYVLVPGENDTDADLHRLAGIAGGLDVNVNLIELNPGAPGYETSASKGCVAAFKKGLTSAGIEAVIRFRRGRDIDAGCGQLALRHAK
jgi:23S rRNA (adenine2503-C2)-methyltransferase